MAVSTISSVLTKPISNKRIVRRIDARTLRVGEYILNDKANEKVFEEKNAEILLCTFIIFKQHANKTTKCYAGRIRI